ncbi:MAG: Rpn family recombination-promoting nuclease/putative transposase [Acidobacteriota bacterium]
MGRYDSGYKLLFSYPYLVECLIRGFVPGAWLERLDFSSLEAVREAHPRDEVGIRYDDMIWRLRWRASGEWIYLYLMLKFQSRDEPFMAVRVLDYDSGLYRQLVRTLKLKRGERLPIVLPVVLYRGHPAWQSSEEVFDLIAPAPPEIEPYLPHLRYLLLDANAWAAEQLASMHNPAACLLWLEGSQDLTPDPIDELDEALSAPEHAGLRRAFALWLSQVFLPSRLPGVTVPEVKKLEEVSPMIAQHAIDWSAQWREEGRREGRQEGRREGVVAILLRMLSRRYGHLSLALEERVRSADTRQLLDWSERFATAKTLAEIFDSEDGDNRS